MQNYDDIAVKFMEIKLEDGEIEDPILPAPPPPQREESSPSCSLRPLRLPTVVVSHPIFQEHKTGKRALV
jgi:hypothetical protein